MRELDVVKILYPQAGDSSPYSDPGPVRGRRFTQDTPILPEVWIAFGSSQDIAEPQDLLLTPNYESSIFQLIKHLRAALARLRGAEERKIFLAYNESHVRAQLTFRELIVGALPLSQWWRDQFSRPGAFEAIYRLQDQKDLADLLLDPGRQLNGGIPPDVLDMIRIAGGIKLNRPLERTEEYFRDVLDAALSLFEGVQLLEPEPETVPPLWSVFSCRKTQSAVAQSRIAIKADAAIRLFELSCKDLVWAVIDSGIDAEHDAFSDWPAIDPRATSNECQPERKSRVLRSYDFTLINKILKAAFSEDAMTELKAIVRVENEKDEDELRQIADDLGPRLVSGRPLDWNLLEPLIRIRKVDGKTPAPLNEHGTHVAGILAADWRKLRNGEPKPYEDYVEPKDSVIGVCPDLRLYDLRVIGPDGSGDEFSVLSALQFVRYLNMNKDKMVVHGVNLSFSLPQQVKSFACGSSPVCQECERLVNSGVVVVTAAGNRGYLVASDGFEWYRNLSITDPGNADCVITVGSTHRSEPHRYGVSYFSSRGPTGDGRVKPDLVAPGEKIRSIVPSSRAIVALDGTSMAAPHASGAAALLMARHKELIGRPRKIKEVLCGTATDLGRERFFQGAGMLDVLRAMQSV
jgi:hypothetical protein